MTASIQSPACRVIIQLNLFDSVRQDHLKALLLNWAEEALGAVCGAELCNRFLTVSSRLRLTDEVELNVRAE